jgi:hypothetical protein
MTRKVTTQTQYVKTDELIKVLGCDRDHLLALIKDGSLRIGIHFLDLRSKNSNRAVYRWNLENCLNHFATPPDDRVQ